MEMNTKQVQEINEPDFKTEVLRCAQPVLVGFLAGWSKPSRLVEPVLDEVAAACNGKAKILKVSVDEFSYAAYPVQINHVFRCVAETENSPSQSRHRWQNRLCRRISQWLGWLCGKSAAAPSDGNISLEQVIP